MVLRGGVNGGIYYPLGGFEDVIKNDSVYEILGTKRTNNIIVRVF